MRLKKTWLWYFLLACCWGDSLQVPQHVVKELRAALLPLFGLQQPPKTIGKVQVPEALRKLYQLQTDFDLDTASLPLPGLHTGGANTVRSFTHVESPVDATFKTPHTFRLKFNPSNIPKTELLQAAELRLSRDIISPHTNQRVLLEDIIQPGIKGSHGPITRVIDSKRISTATNDTLSLDILPAVLRWLENPKSNFGVLVRLSKKKTPHVRLRRSAEEDDDAWQRKQPLLFTYSDDGKNKQKTGEDMKSIRSKRAVRRAHRKGERDPCRRRTMYVDFRAVGWNDWIVAPLGYEAFYCGGECEYPMAEHLNTTNHAIVQSLMNSANPNKVPKPCCTPTQLSSMSMLYVDSEEHIILKNYREMVVMGCGCR